MMLCENVLQMVEAALFYQNGRPDLMRRYAETNEDADALRMLLAQHNLVAFVAEGSMLLRRMGVEARPLSANARFAAANLHLTQRRLSW